jgi:hypothetical protein
MLGKYLSDPTWLLTIFTLVGVIVAVVTLWLQTKSFKLTIGADLGMKLDDRFDSSQFAIKRLDAATALKNNSSLENAEDVFDFFDTVGLFVRLGALKAEIAHSLFFHWINLYWRSGEHYIKDRQKEANLTWADFEKLYSVTRAIEKRKDPGSRDLRLTPTDIEDYLDDEIASTRPLVVRMSRGQQ